MYHVAESTGGVSNHREMIQTKKENQHVSEENNLLKIKIELLLDMVNTAAGYSRTILLQASRLLSRMSHETRRSASYLNNNIDGCILWVNPCCPSESLRRYCHLVHLFRCMHIIYRCLESVENIQYVDITRQYTVPSPCV